VIGLTRQKAVVERYTEGFRRGDLDMLMSCLTEDVVWPVGHGSVVLGDVPAP
jgi:ketosteroid isomerase-like protein